MRTRRALLTVLALLTVVPAPAAHAHAADHARKLPRPPQSQTFVYTVTFKAEVDHEVGLIFGPGSSRYGSAVATVKGRIPDVHVTRQAIYSLSPQKAKLKTVSGVVETAKYDPDGTEVLCKGNTIERGDFEHPALSLIRRNGLPTPTFTPFQHLTLLTTCTGGPDGTSAGVYSLPGIPMYPDAVEQVRPGVLRQDFHRKVTYTPESSDTECPDELVGYTDYCTYTLDGTLTYRLQRIIKG
ncbi:hypothetical protein G5V58_02870 [Nocardioides anomalus]|uniref:DUF3108 domain-containing protein n=1 Tax=Nocardioides anomalus TaxID=2712223 RepID=A0A6G6W9G5_9ACTN|nr:hypothetical protein [Nocardioides anomalus]QIG41862.1 hypothetical protein G5V58_02870 [Nocardioides anomalus]